METKFFPQDGILYVKFRDTQVAGGRELDESRHLDLDTHGDLRGIVLADVSEGVDLEGIPDEVLGEVKYALKHHGIPMKQPA